MIPNSSKTLIPEKSIRIGRPQHENYLLRQQANREILITASTPYNSTDKRRCSQDKFSVDVKSLLHSWTLGQRPTRLRRTCSGLNTLRLRLTVSLKRCPDTKPARPSIVEPHAQDRRLLCVPLR